MNFRPDRDHVLREYKYMVIVATEADRRPSTAKSKWQYSDYYHKGQIVVVETTGGCTPTEVGTWGKPTKTNCMYIICSILQEAINVSYAVADGEYDEDARRSETKNIQKHKQKRRRR
jgi:hypothetical protein